VISEGVAVPRPRQYNDQIIEILYESERTRITRLQTAGGERVVRKEPLGADGLKRARHELRLLQRLQSVPGVVRLAAERAQDEILMIDTGGRTLADLLADRRRGRDEGLPVGVIDIIALAERLARQVADVHHAGVVHLDLNPTNILVTARFGESVPDVHLIDFHLSSELGDDALDLRHQSGICGTLPYLAPEQTGRTAVSLDERADLYGIGSVLYEIVTGRPPFPIGDPLQMLRDVLTEAPVPPADRALAGSGLLSDVVLRLLAKDPDLRYQSAEGLAHDLGQLRNRLAAGDSTRVTIGERDFPRRLRAPSQPIGREVERAALQAALARSLGGQEHAILVTGPRGAGKTVLANTLRSAVTELGGWFVTGAFDGHRQDLSFDGMLQALRSLGRLLLAGAAGELSDVKSRITVGVGAGTELLTVLPEFSTLLDLGPFPSPWADTVDTVPRLRQAVLDLLAVFASPRHPVVIVLDDLHRAGAASLAWLDAVRSDDRLGGVLVVGCWRDDEAGADHLLTRELNRWRLQGRPPPVVRVASLDPDGLCTLVADMLRLPAADAQPLAGAIAARTGGNPLDSIELINALRQADVLRVTAAGWTWDADAIRRFLGANDLLELVSTRIARLPDDARQIVDALACLGGVAGLTSLAIACGSGVQDLRDRLLPAFQDGLVTLECDDDATVRLRNDRVREVAWSLLDPPARRRLPLTLARRLAAATGAEALAAEQYLRFVEAIEPLTDLNPPEETHATALLFVAAAANLKVLHPEVAVRYLDAAELLLADAPAGDDLARQVRHHRHAVLYNLGRLTEADVEFAAIERSVRDPYDLCEPLCLQIAALTHRGRTEEAIHLGLGFLRIMGMDVPDGVDATAEVVAGLPSFLRWAEQLDPEADLSRPEPDRSVQAVAAVLKFLGTPAHLNHPSFGEWLILAAQRVWTEHGPCSPLIVPLSGAATMTVLRAGDYRTGHTVARHIVMVGEARGYEPATSLARHLFTLLALHWHSPLEEAVPEAHQARDGLLRGGEVLMGCFAHYSSLAALFDVGATIDRCADEAQAALALAARTDNSYATHSYQAFRQACLATLGRTAAPGSFNCAGPAGEAFDEEAFLAETAHDQAAQADFHVYRAVSAAIANDPEALVDHALAARPRLPFIATYYTRALGELVHGLALAHRVRTADPDRPTADVAAELESSREWMHARAADEPVNFAHLASLLDAEQAWAHGDLLAALRGYDIARAQVAHRNRPWHRALITERAARCHLAAHLTHAGHALLVEAARQFAAWGATGKVRQLHREYPFLTAATRTTSTTTNQTPSPTSGPLVADSLDLMAVLRTSQALSSETNFDHLRVRVGEVIGAMTGATRVLLAIRDDENRHWTVWETSTATSDGVAIADAGHLLPLTAFQYCIRSGEVLLVPDAVQDDRFAPDPYLAGMAQCSLLVVPIGNQDMLRTVLVLENRASRGAFTADRTGALPLVTGQLSVSIENARLYSSLERRVTERTNELARANRALETLSTTDALTGLANRRAFDVILEAAWQDATRDGTPLALTMLDVDRFKLYNDRYGHPAGDECLRRVAHALQQGLREYPEVVCRYGGEEFAVILPGMTIDGMRSLAERLRRQVEALHLPHADGNDGIVTISVGIAACNPASTTEPGEPPGPRHAADLVQLADAGLYAAKHQGRNRVCSRTSARP
jgi:diguanylate cyclase (GGDEF)-like protein